VLVLPSAFLLKGIEASKHQISPPTAASITT
jgi:hypothetical protein